MSNFCQNCERMQSKPVGTAPERPQFHQPTKYDHYENFQKFKQLKEEELQLKRRIEELLKLNPNFTDFRLIRDLTKEDFEQLNTQRKEKVRPQCENYENSDKKFTNSTTGLEDSEADNRSLQKHKSLLVLTRTPLKCPISACSRTISVSLILSHYLRDHNEEFGVPCEEIYAGKRSILKFDPTLFKYGENVCLGILVYSGDASESSSSPSERGLCINNAFLPKPYEHLATQLPILIMACQTSWSTLLDNNGKQTKSNNSNFLKQELLVIWLTSPQTVKPIHCTVTVYDKLMKSSRSSIMQIRDLNDKQTPFEFMPKETNFIRLSHGDINILSHQRTENIHMEIMINEYIYKKNVKIKLFDD